MRRNRGWIKELRREQEVKISRLGRGIARGENCKSVAHSFLRTWRRFCRSSMKKSGDTFV